MSLSIVLRKKILSYKNSGFGLVEVLTAVAILAILGAIAIPSYLSMKDKGLKAVVDSDVANAALEVSAYRLENTTYPQQLVLLPENVTRPRVPGQTFVTTNVSNDVDLVYTHQLDGFCIAGTHQGITYKGPHVVFNSRLGRPVEYDNPANQACDFPVVLVTTPSDSIGTNNPGNPSTDTAVNPAPDTAATPDSPLSNLLSLIPSWSQIRNNMTRVMQVTEAGGFLARQPQGSNGGLTSGEPALMLNMKPTKTGTFDLKGVTLAGNKKDQSTGGFGIVIQGEGERDTFSGYTVQVERNFCNGGACVTLREWENGKEKTATNATPLPKDFNFNQPADYSVSVNGTTASLSINGEKVFAVDNLKDREGVFGVRTWSGNDLSVQASSVTVPR